jgi:pimeloyl-ACP methyl ester carboxylesterase
MLQRDDAPALAYNHTPSDTADSVGVIFLPGFGSDMDGTKATYLEQICARGGRAYTRMDYRGHGQSGGAFEDGTITQWRDDVLSIIDNVTSTEKLVLVGSSMGGWLALLAALVRPTRVRGIVGIAAAPDFTADIHARLSDDQRERLSAAGQLSPDDGDDDIPFVITRDLIMDGEGHRLLNSNRRVALDAACLVQGMCDADVPWGKALQIQQLFDAGVGETAFVPDGDHRLSRDEDLELLARALDNVCARVAGQQAPRPFEQDHAPAFFTDPFE